MDRGSGSGTQLGIAGPGVALVTTFVDRWSAGSPLLGVARLGAARYCGSRARMRPNCGGLQVSEGARYF